MCPSCFCKGREGGKHKAWHDYKVVVRSALAVPSSPGSPAWPQTDHLIARLHLRTSGTTLVSDL
jgi:hypothetical protein